MKSFKSAFAVVCLCGAFASLNAQPSARFTECPVIKVPAGETNVVGGTYLNTGSPEGLGAGQVESIMYSVSGNVTNGAVSFCAYDGGVVESILTVSGLKGGSSGRVNLTNECYTGRMVAVVSQSATNELCRWSWSVILK